MRQQTNCYWVDMEQINNYAVLFCPEGPEMSAEGIVTAKFVKMLCSNGWNVLWICHGTTVNYGGVWEDERCQVETVTNETLLKWSKRLAKIPVLKYIYLLDSMLWSVRAYRIGRRYTEHQHVSCILSRIMPQYGHLPALLLNRKTKIRWIANWSDPMPHAKAPIPYGKGLSAKMSRWTKWYLKSICENVAYHTFPSKQLMDYYLNYLPANPKQCRVVPHIIDKDLTPANEAHQELRIYHIGGGMRERNPHLFFQALHNVTVMDEFRDMKLDVKFVGPIESDIENLIKTDAVDGMVELVGRKPYHVAMEYISQADIVLVIEAQMQEGIFLPSKVADILSCHKPIFAVSPPRGVLADLIANTRCGIATNGLSLSSIEDGLKELFREWKKGGLNVQYNSTKAYNMFSEANVWNEYTTLLNI